MNINDTELFENMDSLNPYESFNKLYNKSEDIETLNTLIIEIMKYDIYDFIAKVSALNLVPQNQNKSILFDALIQALMTNDKSKYNSTKKMSSGRFRRIIEQLGNMNLKAGIDPAEIPFIERVLYYENYLIFSGINYFPGYTLQILINTLFLHQNNFDVEFLRKAAKLISFILTISNSTAHICGYNIDMLEKIEASNIIIPDAQQLEMLRDCIILDNNYISNFLDDESLVEELYYNFGLGTTNIALNAEQQAFFCHPFLKVDNNKTIILNISILASFVFHKIIWIAEQFNIKNDLISTYNMNVWNDCKKSFDSLGHKKIKETTFDITLCNRNYYKEIVLNICNNQFLIVTFLCDDGKDYSVNSIFDMYPNDQFSNFLNERVTYITNKILSNGIPNEDIFHIIVINTFGRDIPARMSVKGYYRPIMLNPYSLRCIAINERNQHIFLPRYIRAKNKLNNIMPNLFSELNTIELYVSNDYSFYFNDDFNPKNTTLLIAPGDCIDYIIRSIKKENRHLVDSFKDNYLAEVVLNDEIRNIYTDVNFFEPIAALEVEFDNVNIWIYSPIINKSEELNLYFSIVDALAYWISECKDIIESIAFKYKTLKIEINLSGNPSEYYNEIFSRSDWNNHVKFSTKKDVIVFTWSSIAFGLLNKPDNSSERKMIESVLNNLKVMATEESGFKVNQSLLNNIFKNSIKMKFFALEYTTNPYFKPMQERKFRKIKSEDENELLDEIGNHLLSLDRWTYGIVKDEERGIIANYIVGYLYSMLQDEIKKIQEKYLYELVCYDLEIIIYNLMLTQNRYSYDIACYPEKENKIFNEFSEINKSSTALKFLAEYIAACPPNGTRVLGEWQYEKILAICSLIIDWAYKNDLFHYNIFNTHVEILKSNRIGMKRNEFDKLKKINERTYSKQLNRYSNPLIESLSPTGIIADIEEKLNEAFIDEYGYSFDEFSYCITAIIQYGDSIPDEVKRANKSILIPAITEISHSLKHSVIEKILNNISLIRRDDFLTPNEPYRKEDVYPWRFNRELSFTRRPVIIRDDEVIWGNRQLFHMLKFTIDLIHEGKLKSRSKKLKVLLGEISNKRGNDFNYQVFTKIKALDSFIIELNLKKINKKAISDDNGNTLGDIDILYINTLRKRIVLAEVKDFNYSKNPYEMQQEYLEMFVDTDNKKCYATKHKKRAKWVEEHIEDVKMQFGLKGDGWTVQDIFIVNEDIISNSFYNVGAKIFTYTELTKSNLFKI